MLKGANLKGGGAPPIDQPPLITILIVLLVLFIISFVLGFVSLE